MGKLLFDGDMIRWLVTGAMAAMFKNMRFALLLTLMPLPTAAWEFSPDPICTLSYQQESGQIVLTYDAAEPLYSVAVTLVGQSWTQDAFTMRFAGGNPPQIGTTRQVISEDEQTLTVTDTGFGNVLDGLQSGVIVYTNTGETGLAFPLEGINAPLAAFRACPVDLPATS